MLVFIENVTTQDTKEPKNFSFSKYFFVNQSISKVKLAMTPIITYALLIFIGLYTLIIIGEALAYRNVRRFIFELTILTGVIILLNITTGFPYAKRSFSGVSSVTSIFIMFLCTNLGIVANYFFSLNKKINWINFMKSLCVSPIVLLPLIGSVQNNSEVEPIQLISFGILAFQNGFFWRVVFKRAKTKI